MSVSDSSITRLLRSAPVVDGDLRMIDEWVRLGLEGKETEALAHSPDGYGGVDLPSMRALGYGYAVLTADTRRIRDPERAWDHLLDVCARTVDVCRRWPLLDLSVSLGSQPVGPYRHGGIGVGVGILGSNGLTPERVREVARVGVVRLAPVTHEGGGWIPHADPGAARIDWLLEVANAGVVLDLGGIGADRAGDIGERLERPFLYTDPFGASDAAIARLRAAGCFFSWRPARGVAGLARLVGRVGSDRVGVATAFGRAAGGASRGRVEDLTPFFAAARARGLGDHEILDIAGRTQVRAGLTPYTR